MNKRKMASMAGAAILLSALTLSSCKKDRDNDDMVMGPDVNAYVLTDNNDLYMVNAMTNATSGQVTISGLDGEDRLIGIDFRPATGQLYGISSGSRIYVIDLKTGAARAIGSAAITPALSGTIAGFDFNPTVDRIRIVTADGQNLRVHPETGAIAATDGSIANTSAVTSVAYTDNRAGTGTTTLYDIDTRNNKLFKQDPPNEGTLVEVGNLEVDAEDAGGFDIGPDGSALAALTVNGTSALYTVDVNSGRARRIGNLSGKVVGLAIPTDPVAYVISAANELVIYNNLSGSTVAKAITGLQPGESVLGIDTRPVNGQLYILGSSSRVYTVNASSGAAVAVGSSSFSTPLSGTSFGFDFNPAVDRIRIVSNTGQNLRVHPETGVVAFVDGMLKPGTPSVTAAAYTNNFAGTTATVLYDIDSETNMLYKQDPPNDGTLTAVGPLGIDVNAANGFDIGSTSGTSYALLTTSAGTKLYSVSLTTGTATVIRDFPFEARGFTLGLGF
ncbi:MAG: DUF4394 domain-containing protein [Flavitalea sp.]